MVFIRLLLLTGLTLVTLSSKAEKIQLALNWKAEPEFGGFYTALIEGYYKAQGLDVEILEGGSGTPTVQMLAAKKIPYAIVSADEIILSRDRSPQNKIKALFSVFQKSPYALITTQERQLKSLEELWRAPGVLAVQSGLPYFQFLSHKYGKPKAKVVPYTGGVAGLKNTPQWAQQGFISIESIAAENMGVKTRDFLIADAGYNPYLVVLAAHEEQLQKQPAVTQKLLLAVQKGWETYLQNPQKTNEYMAGLNKAMKLEVFQQGALRQKPFIRSADSVNTPQKIGKMEKARWETLIQQLFELKLIKNKMDAQSLFLD